MAKDNNYDASSITVLEGLEAVRKRPGMYIGSVSTKGLNHLIYEIVDNSVDEHLAGYCDTIKVTLEADGSATVEDNGRGIPVGMHEKGISAERLVFTTLHAGGKFNKDSYKVSGGLHGVGASVVNALSEWLVVHVRRDGAEYEQSFKRGKPDGDLKKIGVAASTGTTVTFKPDPEMFTETTEYDYEILLKRLREESFLNAGVKITLTDEQDVPDALARLRVIYPNLMRLDYDNLRTREDQEITAPERAESITPLEHFSAFYQLQNNQPLSEEQAAFCQQLIESIWKGEDDA